MAYGKNKARKDWQLRALPLGVGVATHSKQDALALLHKDTGTAFDERCVGALERVLAREAGRVVQLPTPALSVRPSAAAAS